ALLALAGLVLDPGPFVEGLVALAGDLREVDEQVLAALVGRDEPVALRSVEPLDGTGSHVNTSLTTHERVEKRRKPRLGTRSCSPRAYHPLQQTDDLGRPGAPGPGGPAARGRAARPCRPGAAARDPAALPMLGRGLSE